MILVDSCVIIDVIENDRAWAEWSQKQLESWSVTGTLLINPVIYAELSIGFRRIEEVEALISKARIAVEEIPREALFLAGKAFQRYKARGGTRTAVLSDFFIGAHAAVLGIPLLTRDVRRFADYFPKLKIVAPQSAESKASP